AELAAHGEQATSLDYSPDGALLASGSHDKSVLVWDARTTELLAALEGHRARVTQVRFSTDGRWLASGDMEGAIRLHRVLDWSFAPAPTVAGRVVTALAFAPRSDVLLAAYGDGRLRSWDVEGGEREREGLSPYGVLHGLAYDPCGERFVAASA